MKQTVSATLVTALLAAPAAAEPTEKPTVGVVFSLVESTYRQAFSDSAIEGLEAATAETLTRLVAERFGFLQFVPGAHPNRLVVGLGIAAPSGVRPVEFHLEIVGPLIVEEPRPLRWPFRSETDSGNPVGTVAAFTTEIESAFANQLATRSGDLVSHLLGKVKLAETALPIPGPECACWVLPFSKEELVSDEDSRFELRAQVRFAGHVETPVQLLLAKGEATLPTLPPEFQSGIRALFTDEQQVEALRDAIEITPMALRLTVYNRLFRNPVAPPPPSELPVGEEP